MPSKAPLSRSWVFTLHVENEHDWSKDKCIQEDIKYLEAQLERGEDTGRLHYQGVCILHKPKRMAGTKLVLGDDRVHVEIMRGGLQKALAYVRKHDTAVQGCERVAIGNENDCGQGRRTDIHEYTELVATGATRREIYERGGVNALKYEGQIEKIRKAFGVKRKREEIMPTVNVYWGPTGTGKTHRAMAEAREYAGEDGVYVLRDKGNVGGASNWTGYDPEIHKAVIIEEFYGWIKWNELLGILDKWPSQVRVLYGTEELTCTRFWITSNKDPKDWYTNEGKYETLVRRLTNIEHMAIKHF